MAWGRVSDDFHDHDKVTALTVDTLGLAAVGLWTLCLSWVRADRRRGGLVPVGKVLRLGVGQGRELAARLVEVGLWVEVDGGYRYHDFDVIYDPELSVKRAEAGRIGGSRRPGSKTEASAKQDPSSGLATAPRASARAGATTHYPEGSGGDLAANGRNARASEPPHNDPPGPAERVVADWIATLRARPQSRMVNAIGRHVAAALAENVSAEDVAEALRLWQQRQGADGLGPNVLPSIIHQVSTGETSSDRLPVRRGQREPVPSTTDGRVGEAFRLAREYAEEEQ